MRKESLEKIMAVFGVMILSLFLMVFFYIPGIHTEDMTEVYST